MIRGKSKQDNRLHKYGKLFQQYVVDNWCKTESNDLNWTYHNQDKLRLASLDAVDEALQSGDIKQVGKQFILPKSHPGSERWFYEKYLDAMAIVSAFNKPAKLHAYISI